MNSMIVRNNLSNQVSQHLLEEIVAGSFSKDRPLPTENDLSERFGVSRSAIREGLKMLSVRGMVSIRQGAGTFITDRQHWKVVDSTLLRAMSKGKKLSELVRARMEIEPMFARIAAVEATAEDLEIIEQAVSNQKQLHDEAEAVRCDRDFHRGITQGTHNFVFLVMLDSLNALMEESRHLLVATGEAEVRRSVADHRAIYKALVAKDGAAAEKAMRTHLIHVGKQVEMLAGKPELQETPKKSQGASR